MAETLINAGNYSPCELYRLRSILEITYQKYLEEIMKTTVVSGATIAAAAIALAVSGAAVTTASAKQGNEVHCAGINSCKGTSACKTETSACKGQNECKGQGWLPEKSAKSCEAKGGKVVASDK